MASINLSIGSIDWSGGDIYSTGSGVNQFIRVRGDFDSSTQTITNVVDVSGYFGIETIIPGQQLISTNNTNGYLTVTAVDTGSNTITIDNLPLQTATNQLIRIQPPKGQYFIESGSLTVPAGSSFTFNQVTGSEDSDFTDGENIFGVVAVLADPDSISTNKAGESGLYKLSRIHTRLDTATAHFYITSSGGDQFLEASDRVISEGSNKAIISELSISQSFAKIIQATDLSVDASLTLGAYNIGVTQLDTFGSSSSSNAFPFTGSAQITGSLGVTGSAEFIKGGGDTDFFLIKSSSFTSLKLNSDGVAVFGDFTSLPTAIEGGFVYSASNFYAGVE